MESKKQRKPRTPKPIIEECARCHAKRPNGEQCSRKRQAENNYCGTHLKQYSALESDDKESPNLEIKTEVWLESINGIMFYVDKENKIYRVEDVQSGNEISSCGHIERNDSQQINLILTHQYVDEVV
jgi:hypothetical protein